MDQRQRGHSRCWNENDKRHGHFARFRTHAKGLGIVRTGGYFSMRVPMCLTIATALGLALSDSASAELRSLPVNGSGHVMVTRLGGSRSSVQQLHALIAQAGRVFSGPVHLTDAYVNDADTDVQA